MAPSKNRFKRQISSKLPDLFQILYQFAHTLETVFGLDNRAGDFNLGRFTTTSIQFAMNLLTEKIQLPSPRTSRIQQFLKLLYMTRQPGNFFADICATGKPVQHLHN